MSSSLPSLPHILQLHKTPLQHSTPTSPYVSRLIHRDLSTFTRIDGSSLIDQVVQTSPDSQSVDRWPLSQRKQTGRTIEREIPLALTEEQPERSSTEENRNLLLLIGEPGVGKTHFLKQLKSKAHETDKQVFHGELPTLNSFEEPSLTQDTHDLYLFDALDEVVSRSIGQVFRKILEFASTVPHAWVIVTCRSPYLHRLSLDSFYLSEAEISQKSVSTHPPLAGLLEILPLRIQDTHKAINENLEDSDLGFPLLDLIGQERGKRINHDSYKAPFLSIPRYLGYVLQVANVEGLEGLNDPRLLRPSLSKGYLFEKIIDLRLREEFKKKGLEDRFHDLHRHIDGAKALQQKLALVMYLYGRRFLTREEAVTFFDELQSNLVNQFQGRKELTYFYERSLLKPMDTWVEFDNKDFHDFLAARELQRLGETRLGSLVSYFCIDSESGLIPSWWWDTLHFLCEQQDNEELPLLLMNHCISRSLSDAYADQQLPGNIAQCIHLNEQVLFKLPLETWNEPELRKLSQYLWHFQSQYFPESYGRQREGQLLASLLPTVGDDYLKQAFSEGKFKPVLGVFLSANLQSWDTNILLLNRTYWVSIFWSHIRDQHPALDYRWIELFLEAFFHSSMPSIANVSTMEWVTPYQKSLRDNQRRYVEFYQTKKDEIDTLPRIQQEIFAFHQWEVYQFLDPLPPEGVEVGIDSLHLLPTKKDQASALSKIIEKLVTPQAWLAFLTTIHKREVIAQILEDPLDNSRFSFSRAPIEHLYSALEGGNEELKNAFLSHLRNIAQRSSTSSYRVSTWIKSLVEVGIRTMPEEWETLNLPVLHLEDWARVRFWHEVTEKNPDENLLRKIFHLLMEKKEVLAHRFFQKHKIQRNLSQNLEDELRTSFSKKLLEEVAELEQKHKEDHAQEERELEKELERGKAEILTHWDELLDQYEQTSDSQKYPEQLFNRLVEANKELSEEELEPFVQRIQPILTYYLEKYPDLREVRLTLKTEPEKLFIPQPEGRIWNLFTAINLLQFFPALTWNTHREKFWYSLWILSISNFDWWWNNIGKGANHSDWRQLYDHLYNREDDAHLFRPKILLKALEVYPLSSAYPLLLKIILGTVDKQIEDANWAARYGLRVLDIPVYRERLRKQDVQRLREACKDYQDLLPQIIRWEALIFQSQDAVSSYVQQLIDNRDALYDPVRQADPTLKHQRSFGVITRGVNMAEQLSEESTKILANLSHPHLLPHFIKLFHTALQEAYDGRVQGSKKARIVFERLLDVFQSYTSNLLQQYPTQGKRVWNSLNEALNEWENKQSEGALLYGDASFRQTFDKLTDALAGYIDPPTLSKCIHSYNQRNSLRYAPVSSQKDFQDTVFKVLKEGIAQWKNDEGGISLNRKSQETILRGEDFMQALVRIVISEKLQREQFECRRISLTREAQKDDGKKADFLVQYGMYGPIVIEVKLSHNAEIGISPRDGSPHELTKKYVPKLTEYLNGFGCQKGYLLILNTREGASLSLEQEKELKALYARVEPRIQVIYHDLLPSEDLRA